MASQAKPPSEGPPPYTRVDPKLSAHDDASHLNVPRNDIPIQARRSMEDEARELPTGWIRQYDATEHHQYFVDTRQTPPRSIWTHPYDDEDYLNSIPQAERDRIRQLTRHSSMHDVMAESSDDETLPPRGTQKTFGRKLKDKITGTTHEQRQQERQERAEEERRTYEFHLKFRRAMARSVETGQPQYLGKDRSGKDVYIEPPQGGPGYFNTYGPDGYSINPYDGGMYGRPNTTYLRPTIMYGRPYGMGYGGGLGLPLGLGLGGGMLAGGMLGGGMLLGGGFGGF